MGLFYTYTLAYPDGQVFYVGKGTFEKGGRDRINDHEREARSGKSVRNWYKVRVIRKIWANGGEVVKTKVFETDVEEDALLYEWVLINMVYGLENLTNMHEGGDRGGSYSEEYRENMRRIKKEQSYYYKSEQFRNALRDAQRRLTDEQRARIRDGRSKGGSANKGKHITKEEAERRKREGKGKVWPGFISPDGTIHRDIPNLTEFCRERGLSSGCMNLVGNGKKPSHKGWRSIAPYNPDNSYKKLHRKRQKEMYAAAQ